MATMKYEYIKVPGAGSKSKPVQEGTHLNIVNLPDYERVWSISHSSFNTITSSECSYSYENHIEEDSEKSITETIITEESAAICNYSSNLVESSNDTGPVDEERQYSDVSRLLSSTYNAIIKMAMSIINCYANCTKSNKVDKSQSACSDSIDDFNESNERKEGKTLDASNSWSNNSKLSEQCESKEMSGDPEMPGLIRSLIVLEKLMTIVNVDNEVITNEISAQELINETETASDNVISKHTVNMTDMVEDNCFKKISNDEYVNKTFDTSITDLTNNNNFKKCPKDSCSVSFSDGNMTNKRNKIDNKMLQTGAIKFKNTIQNNKDNSGLPVVPRFPAQIVNTQFKKSDSNCKCVNEIVEENTSSNIRNTVDKKEYYELFRRPKILSCRNRTVTSQTYSSINTKAPWKRTQNYENIHKIKANTTKPTVSSPKDVASRKKPLSFDKPREYRRTNGCRVRNLRKNLYFEKKCFPKQNNKYIKTRCGGSPLAFSPYSKWAFNSIGNVVRPKPEAKSQASCREKTPERRRRQRYPTNQFNIAREKEYTFKREIQKDRNIYVKKIYLSEKSAQTRTTFNCHLEPNGRQPNLTNCAKSEGINAITEIQEEKKFQSKTTDEKSDKYDRGKHLSEYISQRTYNCSNHLEFKRVVPRSIPGQSINSTTCTINDENPSSRENLIENQDTNNLSEIYYSFCQEESAMNNIKRNSKICDPMKKTKTKYLRKDDHLLNSNEIKNDIAQEVNTNDDNIQTICAVDNSPLRNSNRGSIFPFIVSEISPSDSSYIEIKSHDAPNYTRFSLPNSTLLRILKEFKNQVNVDLYWTQERIISAVSNSGRSGDDLTGENGEEKKCLSDGKYTTQRTFDSLQLQEPLIISSDTKEVIVPKTPIVTNTVVPADIHVQSDKSKARRASYTPVYSVLNRDKHIIEFVNSSNNETFFVQSYAAQIPEKSKICSKREALIFRGTSSDSGVIRAANVEEVPFKTIDYIVNIINKNERNKNNCDIIFTRGFRSCHVKRTRATHFTTSVDHTDKKEAFKVISIEKEVSKLIINPRRKY